MRASGTNVSETTVRRWLLQVGRIGRKVIDDNYEEEDLQWAKEHKHWTIGKWKKVIFCQGERVAYVCKTDGLVMFYL